MGLMSDEPLRLVLVQPEIPANTGNIIRLCAAVGVPLHIIEPCGFFWDDRSLRRAGLDYHQFCRLERHMTFEELEERWPAADFYFLTSRAERSFFRAQIKPPAVMVLGSETRGLGEKFLSCNNRLERAWKLPMPGQGRCLNLSTAAGIVVYEALRQLGKV